VRSSKGLWRTPLVALWALTLGTLLTACALVDTVDKRADWMNESVTRFRNQTILRNIVRSARDEPLSFAALSSVQGHNTSTNQFPTFPSIDWVKGLAGGTGSTSSQYNVSSDFTLSPVDDSPTYAALIAPLDASTIALFSQRSGYQTNFLYLLFFDKIRIADADGRVLAQFYSNSVAGDSGQEACLGDPRNGFCGPRTMLGYTLLAYLDLRFNLEKGALAGQTRRPRTQICFERGTPAPGKWSDLGLRPTGGKIALPAKGKGGAPASYCDEEGTWFAGTPSETGTAKGKGPDTGAHYVVYDARNRVWIELSTRSTWGIYQFMGTLADSLVNKNERHVRLIQPGYRDNRDELIVLDIAKGRATGDCFVDAEMDDRITYCVPNGPSSRLTRAAFVILHQLTALQRAVVSSSSDRTLSTRQIQ